jgi:hypothetical protein
MCPVFAEIIAAAAGYEQSNRTHLMPPWERQPPSFTVIGDTPGVKRLKRG